MDEIETQIMDGRNALACRNLNKLLSWKADPTGATVYLLGSCELARGSPQAAHKAWARVVPGTAYFEKAIRGRMRLLHEAGQPAAAEQLVFDAANDRRNDRTAVLMSLVPMFRVLGRIDEAERLIEERWEHLNSLGEGALEPAIKLVWLHIELALKAIPVEDIRAFLEQAARLAPEDDRVWLGRANLAIRTGAYDEAQRWLDECQRRRPDDAAVWHARLDWAIATSETDVIEQAMVHLSATAVKPVELRRINALLAAKKGDVQEERRELEGLLLSADPRDLAAFNRLVQLLEKDRQPEQTAALRHKKEEMDWLQARYEKLYARQQPIRDSLEMARLAEHLGRQFEARGFRAIAVAHKMDRKDVHNQPRRLRQTATTIAINASSRFP
jgi:tetratricopeptide (TPR) repeat protein